MQDRNHVGLSWASDPRDHQEECELSRGGHGSVSEQLQHLREEAPITAVPQVGSADLMLSEIAVCDMLPHRCLMKRDVATFQSLGTYRDLCMLSSQRDSLVLVSESELYSRPLDVLV